MALCQHIVGASHCWRNVAVNHCCNYTYLCILAVALPSMSVEGALWFHDLTLSDPFFILPVLLASSNIINIEVRLLSLLFH